VPRSSSSALVTDQGRRVLLRIDSRFYELTQGELRKILGLPDGPPGLGITVDRGRLRFEFAADKQSVALSAAELGRRLAKQSVRKIAG
jgi:hypothetical protein